MRENCSTPSKRAKLVDLAYLVEIDEETFRHQISKLFSLFPTYLLYLVELVAAYPQTPK